MSKVSKTILVLVMLILTACQSASASLTATPPPPQVVIVTDTPLPTSTPRPSPTPTLAQWIFPYTVDGLRQHHFQSGEIHIRQMLEKTDIYTRYLVDYPSDGLTITGILQIPVEGHAPFPVIVMNHGYFNREDYTSGDGTWRAAEYLNKHGYLTLSSDYRSWGGSDTGPSLFYSGLVIDVINLIKAIPSIPQADAQRVGIWGHSMGGGVTVKVLTIDSTVKAAVLYSTVSADDADVINRWGEGCIGDILAGEKIYGCNSSDILPLDLPPGLIEAYGQTASDTNMLRLVSSFYRLGYIAVPVEINYGAADGKLLSGTPPEWSKKLYQGLLEAGKDAKLFAYEGEDHSFNGDAWLAFMERSARFFDENVKNAP